MFSQGHDASNAKRKFSWGGDIGSRDYPYLRLALWETQVRLSTSRFTYMRARMDTAPRDPRGNTQIPLLSYCLHKSGVQGNTGEGAPTQKEEWTHWWVALEGSLIGGQSHSTTVVPHCTGMQCTRLCCSGLYHSLLDPEHQGAD